MDASNITKVDLTAIIRRVNARSKRMRLVVKNNKVYLTLPPNATERMAAQFLQDAVPWLERHWPTGAAIVEPSVDITGTVIHLPILQTTLKVQLDESVTSAFALADKLYVPSKHSIKHLQHWLKIEAQRYLPNRLLLLSKAYNLPFAGCTIRHTTTRWGSCSSRKTISLNAALMLLSSSQIDYVLLHELAHTHHMNHSATYWQLVEQICPNYRAERSAIKNFIMPAWWKA